MAVRQIIRRFSLLGIAITLLATAGCNGETQTDLRKAQFRPLMPGDRVLHLKSPLTPELTEIAAAYINSDATLREDTQLDMDVYGRPFDMRQDMEGAFANIDDEGEPEAFLRFAVGPFCGTDGCWTAVLKKLAGRWQPICEADAYTNDIVILKLKDHGFNLIVFRADGRGYFDIVTWPNGRCGEATDPISGTHYEDY